MSYPKVPRQVVVMRTVNHVGSRISSVRHYDSAMKNIFPYFVKLPSTVAGDFTDALGTGYSDGEYGPFWPSFSSMNTGEADTKAVWFSQAGLECLQKKLSNRYLLTLEPIAEEVLREREEKF